MCHFAVRRRVPRIGITAGRLMPSSCAITGWVVVPLQGPQTRLPLAPLPRRRGLPLTSAPAPAVRLAPRANRIDCPHPLLSDVPKPEPRAGSATEGRLAPDARSRLPRPAAKPGRGPSTGSDWPTTSFPPLTVGSYSVPISPSSIFVDYLRSLKSLSDTCSPPISTPSFLSARMLRRVEGIRTENGL